MTNALEITGLVKKYKDFEAVAGLDFNVTPGEIFALVGPNGVGKSTTLKMIATILTPTAGSAAVFGLDTIRDAHAVREIISYLPEEAGAYKNLTGREYLDFMAMVFLKDGPRARAAAAEGERLSGLGARLGDKIKTYSKGMARKLLLARAVMIRPRLAILDEPTSGLDIVNAYEIRKTIKALAAGGMTFLISSHNMGEIEFLSGRIGVINKGRMLACDTPAALKARFATEDLEEVFIKLTQ
ncbi:MAG TPA: multidrug ABC transporter ATP-binding protein [Elusimicrobia bacterium]|nr:MAG: multidrug ABC transporter ATP-binding protein [Elusimicrobia bacterium GWA2_64_40]OGR66779.1 MAG: multidrug ABC transporter ATP-binding protein [Elusimicrobia bacterium GWB2_63_16]HAN03992.1 multidrug ABC transporter ATP-binding protein [Elusimicrobiota bacterium]HAU89275.1 multidrug ABC transporter ATP-binding protein [Elusimicrobiota bacterium]